MLVFKRNMTRGDCKREQFSGVRKCDISQNHEIWLKGTLVKEITEHQLTIDEQAIQKAYAEVFKLGQEQVIVV